MSTSDKSKSAGNTGILIRMLIVLAIALFGMIYEHFGHGVYSNYMIYAFLIPFTFSLIPAFVVSTSDKVKVSGLPKTLWDSGTAFLTAGCIFKGILDIYGTSNAKTVIYPIVAGLFFAAALLTHVLPCKCFHKEAA